ncbi:MAG: hypothetical protein WB502_15025 [Thermoactinomyces sp.]
MKDTQIFSKHDGYPRVHVIGYIVSVFITLLVCWFALVARFPWKETVMILLVLAASQLLIHLIFFMRMAGRYSSRYHAFAIALGFLFVFTVMVGSVWFVKADYF